MAPAAEGSRKRKSALSYDLRNPHLLPLLVVEKELFLTLASRGSPDRCNTNRGCILIFSRREEHFPRLSMPIIYGHTVDLWAS